MKTFDKYEKLGAYHWEWYTINHTGYKDLVDLALKFLPNKGSILDAGCGDGLTSFKLFEKGLSVLGIEINPVAINQARSECKKEIFGRTRIKCFVNDLFSKYGFTDNNLIRRFSQEELKFINMSIYDLDMPNSFDYALCHDIIEHVEYPEVLLEKVYSAIKRFCIISTPNGAYKEPKEYDFKLWTQDEFSDLLRDYDFEYVYVDKSKMYVKLKK